MTDSTSTTQTSKANLLATLRALTVNPTNSSDNTDGSDTIDAVLGIASAQAERLRGLLLAESADLLTTLTRLFPNLTIQLVDDLPLPAISFWASGRWHVRLDALDSVEQQHFWALHELEHIIDHPFPHLTGGNLAMREASADYFASQVLLDSPGFLGRASDGEQRL